MVINSHKNSEILSKAYVYLVNEISRLTSYECSRKISVCQAWCTKIAPKNMSDCE